MRDDWILDVLADLGDFARINHLEALAFALGKARDVARVELSAERIMRAGGGDLGAGSLGAHTRNLPDRPGP
jgi:hypothetical protein